MEINGFEVENYNIHGIPTGATASTCPKCSHERKKKTDKCMSVFWDEGLGQCNHCGERVQLHTYKKKQGAKEYIRPVLSNVLSQYSNELIKYCKDARGISESTLKRLKIRECKEWIPQTKKESNCVAFDYYLHGELINTKFRDGAKNFKLVKDAEKILYNLDSIINSKECLFVEGEFDVCAWVEAGYFTVVSVPNGFTTKTVNTEYLDNYIHIFDKMDVIYLGVDNDEAGQNGQNELIRRLGSEKIKLIDYQDCKDANEFLLKHGKESLYSLISEAKDIPLDHIETINDFKIELYDFWINGSPKGFITGLKNLDKHYSNEWGQYTVITGAPQSGKSEILDAMCIGYALKYGYKTAFASPENKPNKLHANKIIKKIIGFQPNKEEQINTKNIQDGIEFYSEHFYHVEFNDGYDLMKTLKKFKELVKRKGVRFFVLDPFNKIPLKESKGKNTNDYTSDYLNEIDIFCKQTQSHVFLVMHPNKMQKREGLQSYKMPSAYDIKGGGEVFDMSYHILGVCKNKEVDLVEIETLKIKFQHLGEPDKTEYFKWNFNNGRYVSVEYTPDMDQCSLPIWDNKTWLYWEKEEEIKEEKQSINQFNYTLNIQDDAPF